MNVGVLMCLLGAAANVLAMCFCVARGREPYMGNVVSFFVCSICAGLCWGN